MSDKIFEAEDCVELFKVTGKEREQLESKATMNLHTVSPTKHYPLLSISCVVGAHSWVLRIGTHVMKSLSTAGEPTYIFSQVDESDPDVFFCTIFPRGHPAQQLALLESILEKVSTYHQSKSVTTNKPFAGIQLPGLPSDFKFPQIQLPKDFKLPTPEQVNELMRKGAEDTQLLLKQAGAAAGGAFQQAVELHKQYAPKPAEQPVAVDPNLKDKVAKSKQATAAGAAVAKGVATGWQAATAEIGTSLAATVGAAAGAKDGAAPTPATAVAAAVGGVGVEILRDVAAVRDAMLDAAASAWQGARAATVEVFEYQYGKEAAVVMADACDAVEGVGGMAVAMKNAQPTQLALTAAKNTVDKSEKDGVAKDQEELLKQLQEERAALERERAALQAVKEQSHGGGAPAEPKRGGPFGFFPAFA